MTPAVKERDARIMAAHAKGESPVRIARAEGLSVSRVSRIVRRRRAMRLGQRVEQIEPIPSPMERARASLRHGGTLAQAAALAGMTPAEFDLHLWNNLDAFVRTGRAAA